MADPKDSRLMRRRLRRGFTSHKSTAKQRGIEFLLNYAEWCTIWLESGKWPQRGRNKGQYCMARFGDSGPYVSGNVAVVLNEDNHKAYKISDAGRAALRAARHGVRKSKQTRARMSTTATGRKRVAARNTGRRWAWAHPGDADYPLHL